MAESPQLAAATANWASTLRHTISAVPRPSDGMRTPSVAGNVARPSTYLPEHNAHMVHHSEPDGQPHLNVSHRWQASRGSTQQDIAAGGASLADLCIEDRRRVAKLVRELTVLGQQHQAALLALEAYRRQKTHDTPSEEGDHLLPLPPSNGSFGARDPTQKLTSEAPSTHKFTVEQPPDGQLDRREDVDVRKTSVDIPPLRQSTREHTDNSSASLEPAASDVHQMQQLDMTARLLHLVEQLLPAALSASERAATTDEKRSEHLHDQVERDRANGPSGNATPAPPGSPPRLRVSDLGSNTHDDGHSAVILEGGPSAGSSHDVHLETETALASQLVERGDWAASLQSSSPNSGAAQDDIASEPALPFPKTFPSHLLGQASVSVPQRAVMHDASTQTESDSYLLSPPSTTPETQGKRTVAIHHAEPSSATTVDKFLTIPVLNGDALTKNANATNLVAPARDPSENRMTPRLDEATIRVARLLNAL